ncbi:hypothetical protein [Micromonospora sp. KC723]|uniref:hypothetical protein n=1 Tax=Micromonospora sp. KC723 TaxID=2530381 RepID=UPI001A9F0D16|nr:hypothetical protein [Micromonospora sp. KC723]
MRTASAFRSNLTSTVGQVRDRGGVPVLVTPPVRRLFNGSQLTDTALHVNSVGVNLPAGFAPSAAGTAVLGVRFANGAS